MHSAPQFNVNTVLVLLYWHALSFKRLFDITVRGAFQISFKYKAKFKDASIKTRSRLISFA